ncbi:hypothetical protein LSCM1_07351 [Leishmania martiniquensis]|uniref:Uncharacterized protein n=1 Tax=Leishmania martiniquensis TaxID=1580590 RepID=A0A836KT12_9TRYP|nr:hypothetical protein LSCM1_07351 [Leishmania martiniquensis]
MYTSSTDTGEESPSAFEWRVWGSGLSASTAAMPRSGVKHTPKRVTMAVNVPAASLWGGSRDGGGASAVSVAKALTVTAELAPLASSASPWSLVTVANNTRGARSAAYKGIRTPSDPSTPAERAARGSEGTRTPSRQSAAVPEDLSMRTERLGGGAEGWTDLDTFRCTTVSSEVQPPPPLTMPVILHDSDDGDDDAFNTIKESIKHQLVSIEEDDRASEAARGNAGAAERQTLQPQPYRYLPVQLPSTDGDGLIRHTTGAPAPPAPRSAAAARQRETATTRVSSSSASVLEQLAATVGHSSVARASGPLTSGSGSGASSFHSQPPPPPPHLPPESTQTASHLTSQAQQPQRQQCHAQSVVCPRSVAASRATLFEQQRQPSANGVGCAAGSEDAGGDAKTRTGGLHIPLPISRARPVADSRGFGGVAAISTFAEGASRPSSHLDPSRDMGSGAAAAARPSATPSTTSSSSASTARQGGRFSAECSSSSKDEPLRAGRSYHPHSNHQYSHQLRPSSFASQPSHILQLHQPDVPSLQLEGLQEKYAAKHQQACLHEDTQRHHQPQPQPQSQPSAPLPPPPPLQLPHQSHVQASPLTSHQDGPRQPNLPPHLRPQVPPQTQQQSHPQQLLPQPHPQHSQQQQQRGGPAPCPSAAMTPGKTYAATPYGRLILLTPEGVRASGAQPLQQSLPSPPPPPSPPSATAFALTGNYVTASSCSALFCRNNPLHSMRYPGSESESARQLGCDAGRLANGAISLATPSSHIEDPGVDVWNRTASLAASEQQAAAGIIAGQSPGTTAENQAEARVTTPTVVTNGNSSVEVPPFLTRSLAAAAGTSVTARSSAATGGSCGYSATASAIPVSQPSTDSLASPLTRCAHGSAHSASVGELVQRLGSHSSGGDVGSMNLPLQLPAFVAREDVSRTSPAGGAHHRNLRPAAVSPLSSVRTACVGPERNAEVGTPKALAVLPISSKSGGSNAQMAMPGSDSGSHDVSSVVVAIGSERIVAVAGPMALDNNARGNSSAFARLPTGLEVHNSGFRVDTTGASDCAHGSYFTHSTPQPADSPLASAASYIPPVAVGSVKGGGSPMHISVQAALCQETVGNKRPALKTDAPTHAAKPTWPDTVSLPLTQDPAGPPPPPPPPQQRKAKQQQQQQLHMRGPSSSSASHSSASGRLHATADDSVVVAIPVTTADGTITAAVITVPPPFAHTEAGVQQYCIAVLQHQSPQEQRWLQPRGHQQQPLPPTSQHQQQHLPRQGPLSEVQPSAVGAGEGEEWRRQQTLLTLQLEQHRRRLESELRLVELQQAQQQQQQHERQHHHQSPSPVRAAMTTIDGRLYRMASASSVESFGNSGPSGHNLHSVGGDSLARDCTTAVADDYADAASPHLQSHPGVRTHASPQAEL